MKMTEYPWLDTPYYQLTERYRQKRGHHALLIQARPGMGAAALVLALSRWLLCQCVDGIQSCGTCHGCQLMQSGTHPDWYQLEAAAGKGIIGIDAVRKVCEKLYHHAQLGGAKVIWLPNAAQLSEAAASALLKTLEEPPCNTWFILCSHQPERLLATLRSRCMCWHLGLPDTAISLSWLQLHTQRPETETLAALRLSGGAPLAALTLLEESVWSTRQALCLGVHKALAGEMLSLLPLLNRDDAPLRLVWLSALLLDAIKWQQQARQILSNPDQQSLVIQLAERLPTELLDKGLRQWLLCREQLVTGSGINRELLLTDQLLFWEQWLTANPVRRGE